MLKSIMDKVKTIFIGTSEFAVPILEELVNLEFIDLNLVITQPDKPAGRKQKLLPSPVKQFLGGSNANIKILQPQIIRKSATEILEKFEPELIIVASYGQIIPKKILNYPKYGCLNFHGSLLPKLRGAVPIQMSILKGLETTGVTLQKMSFKMDEGDIISQREIELQRNETSESLTEILSELSKDILKEDLEDWIAGEVEAIPQDHNEATYCFKEDIRKENAEINEKTSVIIAEKMVRAFYPWPVVWLMVPNGKNAGKRLKVFKSRILDQKLEQEARGNFRIVEIDGQLCIMLKDGALVLEEVQLEGKERRTGTEYLWIVE